MLVFRYFLQRPTFAEHPACVGPAEAEAAADAGAPVCPGSEADSVPAGLAAVAGSAGLVFAGLVVDFVPHPVVAVAAVVARVGGRKPDCNGYRRSWGQA